MGRYGLLMALLGMVPFNSPAVGTLETVLRYPANSRGVRFDTGTGRIEVVLRNRGDAPIHLDETTVPRVFADGLLFENMFHVRSGDSDDVPYSGIYFDMGDSNGPYTALAAGSSLALPVSLPKNYQIVAGLAYQVEMRPLRYLRQSPTSLLADAGTDLFEFTFHSDQTSPLVVQIDPRATQEESALARR